MIRRKLIGPFTQLVTMDKLPLKGPLSDKDLEIISNAGIITEGNNIVATGTFDTLAVHVEQDNYTMEELHEKCVALPGFVDPHTHICWAGSRAHDYTLRLQGKTYTEIAASGGGIWDTVTQTRKASVGKLVNQILARSERHLKDGVTTIEIKSGYGLTIADELKLLEAIRKANTSSVADLVPTCLAAHICPRDYKGSPSEYLDMLIHDLLPKVLSQGLAKRIDIYIDKKAFSPTAAGTYLRKAQDMGFEITIHGDQFSRGGSSEAVKVNAVSVDHLEVSSEKEIHMLAASNVIPVVLPGSSLGLGVAFAPARKLLDAGASLAIASDWNPGSAPMGDLLVQASVLGIYEKLSIAETLAGISFRAAAALNFTDRGVIKQGNLADIIAFNLDNYQDILYNQGKVKPAKIWKNGSLIQ